MSARPPTAFTRRGLVSLGVLLVGMCALYGLAVWLW